MPVIERVISACRDCLAEYESDEPVCKNCGSERVVRHPELGRLTVAHIDCDAFYATIEKRDNPALANEPVLVGGRERGVVMACCYIARRFGVAHRVVRLGSGCGEIPGTVNEGERLRNAVAIGAGVRRISLHGCRRPG